MKKVREMMIENVLTIHPGATLMEAARKMQKAEIGSLPVCEDKHVVGVITDRDILVRAIAVDVDPEKEIVANVMSMPVCTVYEDDDLVRATECMRANQIRRVIVLDHEKRLVGIVSEKDLEETPAPQRVA